MGRTANKSLTPLGRLLDRLISEAGYASHRAFALKAGVSTSNLARTMYEPRKVQTRTLARYAKALRIDVTVLKAQVERTADHPLPRHPDARRKNHTAAPPKASPPTTDEEADSQHSSSPLAGVEGSQMAQQTDPARRALLGILDSFATYPPQVFAEFERRVRRVARDLQDAHDRATDQDRLSGESPRTGTS